MRTVTSAFTGYLSRTPILAKGSPDMTHRLRPLTLSMTVKTSIAIMATLALALALSFPATASAGDRTVTRTLTFTSTVTSVGTELNELPGDIVYGWNHLTGTTRWGKRSATMDFLGDVDYIDGTGPFGGFVTITHRNGTQLAWRVSGEAVSPPEPGTKDATFTGTIRVIGGSGRFAGATGVGTMTGSRSSSLGGAVTLTFTVRVTRPA